MFWATSILRASPQFLTKSKCDTFRGRNGEADARSLCERGLLDLRRTRRGHLSWRCRLVDLGLFLLEIELAAYQAIPNHWSKIDTSVFALSPGASPWSFEQPPAYDWRTTLGTCLVVIPAVLVYASGWAFRYVVAGATGHPRPARTVPSQRSTVSVRPERQEPPKLIL
jgi:hypothetical protein